MLKRSQDRRSLWKPLPARRADRLSPLGLATQGKILKKYIAPLGLIALLLTGCGSSSSEPSEEEIRAEAIESIVAAIPSQTPAAPAPETTEAVAPETTEAAAPVAEPTTEAPVAAPPEVLAVEAAQMLLDFDGNEAAADVKYKGKILEVTGKVAAVDTQFLSKDKYSVQMNDGTEYGFLRVSCNDIAAEQAAVIVPDSIVTVRGTFADGGNLGVQINDCVVL